jgi:hypothetical protein
METNFFRVSHVAKTALKQIVAGVGLNVVYSWGLTSTRATVVNGSPALKLTVSGLIYKGNVYVIYDESSDLYIVKTENEEHRGVFCDDLGALLDSIIERPLYMSDEEYRRLAMEDSKKKMCEGA